MIDLVFAVIKMFKSFICNITNTVLQIEILEYHPLRRKTMADDKRWTWGKQEK